MNRAILPLINGIIHFLHKRQLYTSPEVFYSFKYRSPAL